MTLFQSDTASVCSHLSVLAVSGTHHRQTTNQTPKRQNAKLHCVVCKQQRTLHLEKKTPIFGWVRRTLFSSQFVIGCFSGLRQVFKRVLNRLANKMRGLLNGDKSPLATVGCESMNIGPSKRCCFNWRSCYFLR